MFSNSKLAIGGFTFVARVTKIALFCASVLRLARSAASQSAAPRRQQHPPQRPRQQTHPTPTTQRSLHGPVRLDIGVMGVRLRKIRQHNGGHRSVLKVTLSLGWGHPECFAVRSVRPCSTPPAGTVVPHLWQVAALVPGTGIAGSVFMAWFHSLGVMPRPGVRQHPADHL